MYESCTDVYVYWFCFGIRLPTAWTRDKKEGQFIWIRSLEHSYDYVKGSFLDTVIQTTFRPTGSQADFWVDTL